MRTDVALLVWTTADVLLEDTANAANRAYQCTLERRCSTRTRDELRKWRNDARQRLGAWRALGPQ